VNDLRLGEEAKRLLEDTEHVLWVALARQRGRLVEQMLAEPSPQALAGHYYRIRALDEPKEALRSLANAGTRAHRKLEAVNG